MKLNKKKKPKIMEQEISFFKELDKSIDSMECGRTMPHDKAMQMIRTYLYKT